MNLHDDVADSIERLQALARDRRPDDSLLHDFIARYYREIPVEDVDAKRIDDAYAAVLEHLHLGRVRPPGTTLVKLLSPDLERDGWESERSILLFVTDDVPFLVDTVRMVLDRHGLGIHLLVHPILAVDRDADDRIERLGADGAPLEAWTMISLDRCAPELRTTLRDEVCAAIDGVQRVVADFPEMHRRLVDAAGDDALLHWLADGNFVFLGAATYRRRDGHLELVEGSELGEYRSGRLDAGTIDPPATDDPSTFMIARTDAVAHIHRPGRMAALIVRTPDGDEVRIVGLLGSAAYRESVFAIPGVRDRATAVVEQVGASVESHTGRAVRNVIETLPRDLVFETAVEPMTELVSSIVGLQERRIVRVFDVSEPVGPWTTVFVYVPVTRFDAALPERIEALVARHYGGEVRDLETLLGASSLARLSMTVRARERDDPERLAEAIDEASTTWSEQARRELIDVLGEVEGQRVWAVVDPTVPADYRARVRPAAAVNDLVHVAEMLTAPTPRRQTDGFDDATVATSFGRSLDGPEGEWRFRVFLRDRPATIAELVPLLEHLGLPPVDQHPSEFASTSTNVHLDDVGVQLGDLSMSDEQHHEVQASFVGLLTGQIEADGLNRLILAAGLDRRQVAILRTYTHYLRQAGFPFSTAYVERAVVAHPTIARSLAQLFDTRFDPTRELTAEARAADCAAIADEIRLLLEDVPSLDDDRICRALLTLIEATDRTNVFCGAEEIAVKLRPHDIAFLPEPRPMFEIFVCSPQVEGVHLRGGRIARGGLRWSDRPEDFRTEVLGLVKAQMVKNAVIVPVGAKGGFVVKGSTAAPGDRDAARAEGVDRYRRFIGALLDVTDNVVDGEVVSPANSVVHDGPDPYFVVAADKGTATFSDLANEIATQRRFWLGDAFASGGSNGYDHKAMGITARGAWESVRRHARVLGKNVDTDELVVVGVGDMSGDVFGNGMLLSDRIRLVAAFDHRHVFLDPDPDPATSFAERRRLFELPRSTWADYDPALISTGGGVHPRSAKSVPITPEVRRALGLDADVVALRPDDLISAVLRSPVDLLWNGGIGTYVKSTVESDADVGDRDNDEVRVDADELRCRMVGEGGNLGLTQLARVEYALGGGLIYTDAIDNSAGVDCSDHEVNLKVVLDELVRDGELTVRQRNELLAEMTDDVAELVLDNNRAQTLALMIARTQSLAMVNVHARYLDALEADGDVDRALEYLPTDKQIAERQTAGSGLRAPEFAVMIASTKNVDIGELLATDLPDDPYLLADLVGYFPPALRDRYRDRIEGHRLRREIIATVVVNQMVNLAGISFDFRMTEDSGASVTDITRAFLASRDIFGFAEIWNEIDGLGASVALDTQIGLFLDARRMAERGTVWMLRHQPAPLAVAETVDVFSAGLTFLGESLDDVVTGRVADDIDALRDERIAAGVPEDLAARSARWPWMHTGFDIVEIAHGEGCNVADAALTYWSVFEAFDVGWLWDGVGALPRSNRWQEQARSALRDDLMTVLAALTRNVMHTADGSPAAWIQANERAVGRALAMHTEIRRAESFDLTTLSVALRQLRNLTLTAVASPRPAG